MSNAKFKLFMSAIFVCLMSQSAKAALMLDQSQLDQNTTTQLSCNDIDSSQAEQKAETYFFTAAITGTLKQIDILCSKGQSGNMILDVYKGISIEEFIAESEIADLQDGWVSFYVDAPVTAGQTYSIGISEESPTKTLAAYANYPGENYSGGKATSIYQHGNLAATFIDNVDLVFQSWVAIPEPPAFAMFGLGGLVIFVRKRH